MFQASPVLARMSVAMAGVSDHYDRVVLDLGAGIEHSVLQMAAGVVASVMSMLGIVGAKLVIFFIILSGALRPNNPQFCAVSGVPPAGYEPLLLRD